MVISRALLASTAVITVAVSCVPKNAPAEDLRFFITDLYGGDGITLAPLFGHQAHFTPESLQALSQLNNDIASGLSTAALASAVSSFTYDVQLGLPIEKVESLGPIIGNRAETLGQGKLNFGFYYTRIDYKRFEGQNLDDISLFFSHIDTPGVPAANIPPPPSPGVPEFELDQVRVDLDLDIEQDLYSFFATYGVTPQWDVNVVVPIVHVRAEAVADATIVRQSAVSESVHQFQGAIDNPHDESGGSATGLGDVLLRTKYNFYRAQEELWPDMAVFGQVKLPTGDEDDLLGSGSTNVLGLLVLSKQLGFVAPHLNIGYEVAFDGFDWDNVPYAVGADFRVLPSLTTLTASVDIFGRVYTESNSPADTVNLALGAKWMPLQTGALFANFIVPLNRNDGLRPNFAWTVGLEATF